MASTLHELLKEPLGTFYDHDILAKECQTAPKTPVKLKDVMMEYDGEPTGLTLCEDTQPECVVSSDSGRSPVRIRGLLEIQSLKWLSDKGRKILLRALRKRDFRTRMATRGASVHESNLELHHVYNSKTGKPIVKKTFLKVIVQARKAGPAVYLTSKLAPGGLVFLTSDCKRSYKILSLDCETYARSRLYFSRYRALHDLRLLSQMPDAVPLKQRDPEWFALRYLEVLAYPEHCRRLRLIHELGDEDINPSFTRGRLVEGTQRELRRISCREVLSLFAAHVKWLIDDQRQQRFNKVFDPAVWKKWEPECARYRAEAREEGYSWGYFRPDRFSWEEYVSSDTDEDRMDVDPEPARQPVPRSKGKKKNPQTVSNRQRGVSPELGAEPARHRRAGSSSRTSPAPSETFSNHYASDFSTDGTHASDSGVDSSSDSMPSSRSSTPPLNFPAELLRPPEPPSQSMSWICPIRNCYYEVDPRKLTAEQVAIVGGHIALQVKTGRVKWHSREYADCFYMIVDMHYREHLTACGLVLVEEGKKCKVRQIFPQVQSDHHDPVNTQTTGIVKEEHLS